MTDQEIQLYLHETDQLLFQKCHDPKVTRDDLIVAYAFAIKLMMQDDGEPDFKAINLAILDRWSEHALKYIKNKAWKTYKRAYTEGE